MGVVERAIDANANRAREALRVLEDLARFVLNDAELSARAKALRHGVEAGVAGLGIDATARLASRDTAGDVGTRIAAPGGPSRESLDALAGANASRAAEALRSLEECAKTFPGVGVGASRAFESLRYGVYELEKSLRRMLPGRARQWRLCVLITGSLCAGRPWEEVARGAIAGGADAIQLREKGLADREFLARAERLVALARGLGAAVIVNDRTDVALMSGADGVHLGQGDLPVERVRALAGDRLIVGVSTSRIEEAREAVRAGADYVGLGPMYSSVTKAKDRIAEVGYLREALADAMVSRVPHLAIGGITAERARELASAGCRGIAVSSAVCGAEDPEGACRALIESMGVAPQPQGS